MEQRPLWEEATALAKTQKPREPARFREPKEPGKNTEETEVSNQLLLWASLHAWDFLLRARKGLRKILSITAT